MPDLSASLHKQDLGHFRIVAEFWGLELESTETQSALEELCASLLDLEAVSETLEVLPAEARSALNALTIADGKIEWASFARKYGDIREMGAGKRDRERPYLKPASTSEFLFYRALIGKAFFESDKGSQEFAYIPEDLLEIINEVNADDVPPPLQPKHWGVLPPLLKRLLRFPPPILYWMTPPPTWLPYALVTKVNLTSSVTCLLC
ncbi:MAG: hypothetical protein IPJ47_19035 [Anaerolineales bacterium]|nr:hypothetical protein [Anaerolineales bacterium]